MRVWVRLMHRAAGKLFAHGKTVCTRPFSTAVFQIWRRVWWLTHLKIIKNLPVLTRHLLFFLIHELLICQHIFIFTRHMASVLSLYLDCNCSMIDLKCWYVGRCTPWVTITQWWVSVCLDYDPETRRHSVNNDVTPPGRLVRMRQGHHS